MAKPPVPSANPELLRRPSRRAASRSRGECRTCARGMSSCAGRAGGRLKPRHGNKFADRLRTAAAAAPPRDPRPAADRRGSGSGNFSGDASRTSLGWMLARRVASAATTREDAKGHLRARRPFQQSIRRTCRASHGGSSKDLSRRGREHARLWRFGARERRRRLSSRASTDWRQRAAHVRPARVTRPGGDEAALQWAGGVRGARRHGARAAVPCVRDGTPRLARAARRRLPAVVAEHLAHKRVQSWEPQAGMLEVDVASGSAP